MKRNVELLLQLDGLVLLRKRLELAGPYIDEPGFDYLDERIIKLRRQLRCANDQPVTLRSAKLPSPRLSPNGLGDNRLSRTGKRLAKATRRQLTAHN